MNTQTGAGLQNETRLTVSAIIPSYNHKDYVEQAISSVLDQISTNSDIDLIVIDDGSTDGSRELLQDIHARNQGAFKLVLKANEGLCRTLNRAIRDYATGQYVAVLASDDMWRKDKIQKQIEYFFRNPDYRLCYSNAEVFGVDDRAGRSKNGKAQSFQFAGWVCNILAIRNFIPAGTVIFSRDLFDEIGGYDLNGLRLEDWDFLIRASRKTPFCFVNEDLLLYRQHGESAISKMRATGTLFDEKIKVLRKNRGLLNPSVFYISIFVNYILDKILRPLSTKLFRRL
jgi:alpha-1,3-rhamnosyltransferase